MLKNNPFISITPFCVEKLYLYPKQAPLPPPSQLIANGITSNVSRNFYHNINQGRDLNHEKKIGEECEQNFYFNWERDLSFTLSKEKRFIIYTAACQENRMLASG